MSAASRASAPRSRRRVFRILGAGLWCLALPLAGELWVRVRLDRVERENPHVEAFAASLRSCIQAERPLWESQKRYRPGGRVEWTFRGQHHLITTNSHGFRGPEITVPKPAGVYRIVCVGGSTTMEGWLDSETYPALLQGLLRERLQDDRVEVINGGVSAYQSHDELARLPDYLALEPDLLLEYNGANDLLRALAYYWRRKVPRTRWLGDSRLVAHHLPSWVMPDRARLRSDIGRYTIETLMHLQDVAAAEGVETVFCTFAAPDPAALTPEARDYLNHNLSRFWAGDWLTIEAYCSLVELYNELLREACATRGSTPLPVADALRGGLDLYADICHLTPLGIERKAAHLAELLAPRVRAALARGP